MNSIDEAIYILQAMKENAEIQFLAPEPKYIAAPPAIWHDFPYRGNNQLPDFMHFTYRLKFNENKKISNSDIKMIGTTVSVEKISILGGNLLLNGVHIDGN